MASNIDKILENFYWRTESISPTSSLSRNKFKRYDPTLDDPKNSSGWARQFYVEWMNSGEDGGITNSSYREAWHTFQIHIIYPVRLNDTDLQKLKLLDRHDLIKQLRDPANRYGYNASNTTDDIGLYHRIRIGDEVYKESEFWVLRIRWRCKILEIE